MHYSDEKEVRMAAFEYGFYLYNDCNLNTKSFSFIGGGDWYSMKKPTGFPYEYPESARYFVDDSDKYFSCEDIEVYKIM